MLTLGPRFERARVLVFIYTHSEVTRGDLFYAEGQASISLERVRKIPEIDWGKIR